MPLLIGKGAWVGAVVSTLSVQTPTISPISNSDFDDPVYAGIQYGSDGNCDYRGATTGSYFSTANDWLLSGLNSEVWIYATKIAGSATVTGSTVGASLLLTTDRNWGIEDGAGGGSQTATIRIQLYDDDSETNELDTRDYVLFANSL